MKLKIGQQFEVVEVLRNGGYIVDVFKVGGHTLHFKEFEHGSGKTLCNGSYNEKGRIRIKYGSLCRHMHSYEVKPVGRLTVKEVK